MPKQPTTNGLATALDGQVPPADGEQLVETKGQPPVDTNGRHPQINGGRPVRPTTNTQSEPTANVSRAMVFGPSSAPLTRSLPPGGKGRRQESSLTPHEAQIEDLFFLRKVLKQADIPVVLIRTAFSRAARELMHDYAVEVSRDGRWWMIYVCPR